jgi:hypothetical protein
MMDSPFLFFYVSLYEKVMGAVKFFRQWPKFSVDVAEIVCQELATLRVNEDFEKKRICGRIRL